MCTWEEGILFYIWINWVQSLSCVRLLATAWTTAHQPSHPSPTTGVHTNPCPSSQWCHPAISSFVFPFSSWPQSLPASGSFPVNQLFVSGGQRTGVSASTSVLPVNTQDWSPLGWTGWISLESKGLSRVLSNTTVQKHQFFSAQLSFYILSGSKDLNWFCKCFSDDLYSRYNSSKTLFLKST